MINTLNGHVYHYLTSNNFFLLNQYQFSRIIIVLNEKER
jgi:hypothetical protein